MRRTVKIFALILIVLGLLVGPGYWAYCSFFTGSDAVVINLKPDTVAPGQARTWRSGPFKLSEDMAPAGLILVAKGHLSSAVAKGREPTDVYVATLARDGSQAKPLNFTLGAKGAGDKKPLLRQRLLLMKKVHAGEYSLTVAQEAGPAVEIDSMQLQIRKQLKQANPNTIIAGFGMLAVGLLSLTLF